MLSVVHHSLVFTSVALNVIGVVIIGIGALISMVEYIRESFSLKNKAI